MATSYTAPRSVIVVDDPHGYVVPSKDVLIIGPMLEDHARVVALGVMQRVGFPEPPLERKVMEPMVKGPRHKRRRLYRGLRP